MRKNTVKQMWAEGKTVVNGWLHIPSSWSAEVMAHQGFDSMTVDMQHGMMSYETAVTMFQAISTTNVMPMARAPWNEPGTIGRLLDAGIMGIICPMVNTRDECEQFVGACRYYPDGYRSAGPTRAKVYAGADYVDHANSEIITMAMIETAQAVENAEEIISVPGLDSIYIGPGDLGITMGIPQGLDNDHPDFIKALEHVVATCKKHGVAAGIHTGSAQYARRASEMGFQFVTLLSDSGMMGAYAKQLVNAFHEGTQTVSGEAY